MPADFGPSQLSASASPVAAAIKKASAATGAHFDYLMKTAMRESSLRPDAKATTSSAAGLFQFIEQTWLGAVKKYGARHGLADAAAHISKNSAGKFIVTDAARRTEILNLRFDATASSAFAGELAQENARFLEGRLGRAATAADLYTAHFLGPAGAVKLMSAAAETKAADILPAAAKANRHVFFDGARAKLVGEVMASIALSMGEVAPKAVRNTASAVPAEETATARQIENRFASFRPAAPVTGQLSILAINILQALDPTRLMGPGAERQDDQR